MHADLYGPAGDAVGVLRSMQVGVPHEYGATDTAEPIARPWTSSFFRSPITGPRWLYTTHLEGNEQADKQSHGSPNHAVLLYSAAHYPLWQAELGRTDITDGGFAENFTVEGQTEEMVCLGDRYALGEAQVEVTDPRFPCRKISLRWQTPGLTERVRDTGRTGWYCQVNHEGSVEAGMPLALLDRPYPEWTIARINDCIHGREADSAVYAGLLVCPLLNPYWAALLMKYLHRASV